MPKPNPELALNTLLRRMRAIEMLVEMVLERDPAVTKDENHLPELRDVRRIAKGHAPRTTAGAQAWEATDPGT